MFGWEPVPAEIHGYTVLNVPSDCPFGIAIVPTAHAAAGGLTLYFATEAPDEIAGRAAKAGGLMRSGPTKLFGYGEIWQIEDPTGVRWGLYRKGFLPQRG